MRNTVISNYNSSTVEQAMYNSETKELTVYFKNGAYVYHNVSQSDFEAFDQAQSQGQALNEYIKPKYTYTQLKEDVSDNVRTDLNKSENVSDLGTNPGNVNQLNS
jgi:hypothetical protein